MQSQEDHLRTITDRILEGGLRMKPVVYTCRWMMNVVFPRHDEDDGKI